MPRPRPAAAGLGSRPHDPETLAEAFAAAAARHPSRTALVCGQVRVTFAELLAGAHEAAGRVRGLGLSPGERLALLLRSGRHYVEALLACAAAGVVAVPVDTRLPPDEIARILAATDPHAALVHADVSRSPEWTAETWVEVAPGADRSVVAAAADLARAPFGAGAGPEPGDLAAILFTAGTSGHALGVMHSHAGLLRSRHAVAHSLRQSLRPGGSPARTVRVLRRATRLVPRLARAARRPVAMTPMAMQNISGHTTTIAALLAGGCVVVIDGFHPRRVLELVERERVTNLGGTPMMLDLVTRVRRLPEYDLRSLVLVMLGGELASPALVRRIRARMRCEVGVGYGATELGGPVCMTRLDDPEAVQCETVGRPLDGVEVRVVDGDGRDASPGELWCRVRPAMLGYWRQPERTSEVLDSDGWYHTRDLAQLDRDGTVRVLGRLGDVAHRRGAVLELARIERAIERVPGVREAAAVAVPAASGDDRIWAWVVTEDEPRVPEDLLLRSITAAVTPALTPDEVRLSAHLPRTPDGKVRRSRLRAAVTDERPESP